jgi:quercetin dioxygenase-like cupin family protein
MMVEGWVSRGVRAGRFRVKLMATFAACLIAGIAMCDQAMAQGCKPIAQRSADVGCWIITEASLGVLPGRPIYWHLDVYATRSAAEKAKALGSTVVEALGKVWLFTIAEADWRAVGGERIAEIGPLPVTAGSAYAAQYMEATFMPGMKSGIHQHSGPEAWYTLTGEMCLETPDGAMVGRAGGAPVIVPGGPPMELTATGSAIRRAVVLVLHDAAQPATTLVHDWQPKGLCSG